MAFRPPSGSFEGGTVPNATTFESTVTVEDDFQVDGSTVTLLQSDASADEIQLNKPQLNARLVTPDTTAVVSLLDAESGIGTGTFRPLFGAVATALPQGESGYPINGLMGVDSGAGKGLYLNTGSNTDAEYVRLQTAARKITNVTGATYNVLTTDEYISYQRTNTGTGTINLPAISSVPDGYEITIKDEEVNAGTNNITVNRNGSDTIDQGTSFVMSNDGQSVVFIANTTTNNWEVN